MSTNLEMSINELKTSFQNISKLVIDNVKLATEILMKQDKEKINIVKENDNEIDKKEILLEETCIQIIAMHQPKGQTLRYIIAMLKVNNDLERISDLAVNMAKSVKILSKYQEKNLFFLEEMILKVLAMLENAIQALLELDTKQAIRICALDEEVDTLKHQQRQKIMQIIAEQPKTSEYFLDIIINGRRLERIADLCTNIAEDIIYIKEGEIIRHRKWD
ncbi:phosphate transport system regulatory protein PhoU [bacterium]|nr:phosphate transport system regulatory protein PhoU [bacterium]